MIKPCIRPNEHFSYIPHMVWSYAKSKKSEGTQFNSDLIKLIVSTIRLDTFDMREFPCRIKKDTAPLLQVTIF